MCSRHGAQRLNRSILQGLETLNVQFSCPGEILNMILVTSQANDTLKNQSGPSVRIRTEWFSFFRCIFYNFQLAPEPIWNTNVGNATGYSQTRKEEICWFAATSSTSQNLEARRQAPAPKQQSRSLDEASRWANLWERSPMCPKVRKHGRTISTTIHKVRETLN